MPAMMAIAALVMMPSFVALRATSESLIVSLALQLEGQTMLSHCASLFIGVHDRVFEGVSVTFPAEDGGNGIVVVEKKSYLNDTPLVQFEFLDCQTGTNFLISASDGLTERLAKLSLPPLGLPFSDAPVVTQFTRDQVASQDGSLLVYFQRADTGGLAPRPNQQWTWFSPQEQCACDALYPDLERIWFDPENVGPDYPESLGETLLTYDDLRVRIDELRAAAMR
jgi:hypothetical protein